MLLDLIATLGGLVVPPAFDFIKRKFTKSEVKTEEQTVSELATVSPEALPAYLDAMVRMKESAVKFFNRDVIGTVSQWVVDLRAAIRPIGVACAFILLAVIAVLTLTGKMSGFTDVPGAVDTIAGIRLSCETMIASWFGHRFTIGK